MGTLTRIGCTIDQSVPSELQKPVALAAPLVRPVQVTTDQVKDLGTLAKQLDALQQEVAQTSHSMRANPIQAPVIFTNLACGGGGEKVRLQHGFGRFAYWQVIGWRGASTSSAPALVSDQSDAAPETTTGLLCLRSYAVGTADLMVF